MVDGLGDSFLANSRSPQMAKTSARLIIAAAIGIAAFPMTAVSHPGSGIIADNAGNVYFTYTGRGVAKLDAEHQLTIIYDNRGGHWMCIDRSGVFAKTQPEFFRRVTQAGVTPAIIYADGGAPIAVSRRGYLYYGAGFPGGRDIDPAGETVARFRPGGKPEVFAPAVKDALAKLNEGVTGLAIAHDDALLIASPSSVWKLKNDGDLVTIASPVKVDGCDENLPENWPRPGLRGLDTAGDGTIFAAATGCRCVVRIGLDGRTDVVLHSISPWAPTGVAVHGDKLYVLEYTHAHDGPHKGWRPRVRLVTGGRITTLFEAQEALQARP